MAINGWSRSGRERERDYDCLLKVTTISHIPLRDPRDGHELRTSCALNRGF